VPINPFEDDEPVSKPRNPFGDEDPVPSGPAGDPVDTIEHAAARIRRLKSLVGSEGLTLSATRELLDHITTALDAMARSIRDRG
jgi:hypothetical protein